MTRRTISPQFSHKREHNPAYSALLARQEIDLQTHEAQSLLPHFHRVNKALYHLAVNLPRRNRAEQVAELKRVVYDVMRQLEENLQGEYARVNLLHDECTQKPKINYSKPLKTSVDLAHPDSRRCLDLLVGFDQMQCKLADLWFALQIDDSTYLKIKTHCRLVLKEGMKHIARLVYEAVGKPNNKYRGSERDDAQGGVSRKKTIIQGGVAWPQRDFKLPD